MPYACEPDSASHSTISLTHVHSLPQICCYICYRDVMPYACEPESAYQAKIRGSASQLRDHICKEMNPVNLHRCK
jgi:hypothetical protein